MFRNGLSIVAVTLATLVSMGGCNSEPAKDKGVGSNGSSYDATPMGASVLPAGLADLLANSGDISAAGAITDCKEKECAPCAACAACAAQVVTTEPVTTPAPVAVVDNNAGCLDICSGLNDYLEPLEGFGRVGEHRPFFAHAKMGFEGGRSNGGEGEVVGEIERREEFDIVRGPVTQRVRLFDTCGGNQRLLLLAELLHWNNEQRHFFKNGCWHAGHCGRSECAGLPLVEDYYNFGRVHDLGDDFEGGHRGRFGGERDFEGGHRRGEEGHHTAFHATGYGEHRDDDSAVVRTDDDIFGPREEILRCGDREETFELGCCDGIDGIGNGVFDGLNRACERKRCDKDNASLLWQLHEGDVWDDNVGYGCF